MTDDDYASEREEQHREWALTYRKPEAPQATGECLNCGKPLEGRRWCDEFCREDWEARDGQ